MWEVIVPFVDIGGIVAYYCWNFNVIIYEANVKIFSILT